MSSNSPSVFFPADNPAVTAHITMLQGIINRLAGASASCKTWCLALVSSLVSLAGATHNPAIVGVALVPIAIFGFVDTMYLTQERAYRELYTKIVKKIRDGSYQRDVDAFEAKATPTAADCFDAILSWAVWPVYLGLTAFYLVALARGWLQLLAVK
jgi:hypothetical protein